jgi:hypothetical protein
MVGILPYSKSPLKWSGTQALCVGPSVPSVCSILKASLWSKMNAVAAAITSAF